MTKDSSQETQTEHVEPTAGQTRPQELRRYPERTERRELQERERFEAGFRERTSSDRVLGLPPVEGFEQSGTMSNEEVRDYLKDAFPEGHVNEIMLARVQLAGKEVQAGGQGTRPPPEKQEVVAGTDVQKKGIVIEREGSQGALSREAVKKEIAQGVGRQVYDTYLDAAAKQKWAEISGDRPQEHCVSARAGNSAPEDFAESYRAYMRAPETLKRASTEKYRFMREQVFDSREYASVTDGVREASPFSDSINEAIRKPEEVSLYREFGLRETTVGGRTCLVREDVDPDLRDDFGRTNVERMEEGLAPLDENGDAYELHHIGQEDDAPLAELKYEEHRGAEHFAVLHAHQESQIDRSAFDHVRAEHWKQRARQIEGNRR